MNLLINRELSFVIPLLCISGIFIFCAHYPMQNTLYITICNRIRKAECLNFISLFGKICMALRLPTCSPRPIAQKRECQDTAFPCRETNN